MGLIVAIFAPDNLAQWPAMDPANPDYQKDIAWFLEAGATEANESRDHGDSHASMAMPLAGRCAP